MQIFKEIWKYSCYNFFLHVIKKTKILKWSCFIFLGLKGNKEIKNKFSSNCIPQPFIACFSVNTLLQCVCLKDFKYLKIMLLKIKLLLLGSRKKSISSIFNFTFMQQHTFLLLLSTWILHFGVILVHWKHSYTKILSN